MFLSANANSRLAGELHDTTFTIKGNPYFVDDLLTIPKGTKVIIEEGCIFLFNPYTGIEVNGNLIVKGKPKSKVVFTSANDAHYNPETQVFANAFDWNGLTFNLTSDTVQLENFHLAYSVYGIKSMNGRMVIHNGTFRDNGQYDCVINETIQKINPDSSFSFNYSPPVQDSLGGHRVLSPVELKNRKKNIVALSFLGLGLIAGGVDGYLFSKYIVYRDSVQNLRGFTGKGLSDLKEKRTFYKSAAIAGASVGGALLVSAFVTYIIPVKDKDTKSSSLYISPVDGTISYVFRFDF
jgi:hypothetical protein